ncbi:class I SAM-dependent methyltransferase [Sedimentibacter sp. zth1]|uniref:class I SAM-dependent methyltransferase n=1 Tax=Sedimentibacter sp. zth1 TaxID=2816908 RepID=UPI001A9306CA|nr:class I SAM-dependent methyltransferase [Sedimentibacter sp. zth1]QSX06109.1 class I SAM-dependent methyltransferase [Sedimentibacter sp. zth1]
MNDNKKCWDRNAKHYDFVIKKDQKSYKKIYELIRNNVNDLDVLEVGTGTGNIAVNIADKANKVIATDFSEEMIKTAQLKRKPENVSFEIADATKLPYQNNSFDAVIISNCLHIMPYPEKALLEIKRVLKEEGTLFAPNFCHKGSLKAKLFSIMGIFTGFKAFKVWSPDEYRMFLNSNGFNVIKHETLKSSFPIEMVICKQLI